MNFAIAVVLPISLVWSSLAQDSSFNSNGVPIHYVERGQGEPIVLIHGNGGSVQTWVMAGVLDNLATDYHVIALDCRGFGKSGHPRDPKQYGPEMGLDIVRLLDHLHITKAHIVGYSMGAYITAQLLITHPNRFLTATLGGAGGRLRWTAEDEANSELEASEWEQGLSGPGRYAAVLRNWPSDEPKPTEELVRQRGEAALSNPNFDRYAHAAYLRSRKDQVVSPRLAAAVEVPTLGIVGSVDARRAELQELKSLRPALTLVVVDGATHSGQRGAIRQPEFVRAIRDFLSSGQMRSR